MDESYLTVQQIAQALSLNRQTVYNWIDDGKLPALQVGPRRVRVRQSDLDAFLEASTTARKETKKLQRWRVGVSEHDTLSPPLAPTRLRRWSTCMRLTHRPRTELRGTRFAAGTRMSVRRPSRGRCRCRGSPRRSASTTAGRAHVVALGIDSEARMLGVLRPAVDRSRWSTATGPQRCDD